MRKQRDSIVREKAVKKELDLEKRKQKKNYGALEWNERTHLFKFILYSCSQKSNI
jgi:hypothetical protein